MNPDEKKIKDQTGAPPVLVSNPTPITSRGVELGGTTAAQPETSKIVNDAEVRDAGVVEIENPAPEFAPPVQISETQPQLSPFASVQPQTIVPPSIEPAVEQEEEIPTPIKAAKILAENRQKIPLGVQGSGVYQADVVDREDKKLPKAA